MFTAKAKIVYDPRSEKSAFLPWTCILKLGYRDYRRVLPRVSQEEPWCSPESLYLGRPRNRCTWLSAAFPACLEEVRGPRFDF